VSETSSDQPTGDASLSRNARRRLRYFDRGAAAYAALGAGTGVYACPICTDEFTRIDAERGELLTLEDVPPKSVGGKPLCLTCRTCNNTAGSVLDAALADLAEHRRMKEAVYLRRGEYSGPVQFTAGGIETNAILKVDESGITIEVSEERNKPTRFKAQINHLAEYDRTREPGVTWHISGTNRAGGRRVFVSILRAAYLAAFSFFGYRFAAAPAVNVVRSQILDPNVEIVPRGAIILADRDDLASHPAIGFLTSPVPGVVVYFPRDTVVIPYPALVILPRPDSPADFYEQLAAGSYETPEGRRLSVQVTTMAGWPDGPQHTWDPT
jgi:hypothetical protein